MASGLETEEPLSDRRDLGTRSRQWHQIPNAFGGI